MKIKSDGELRPTEDELPPIDILERREQNPFGETSSPIGLKNKAMVGRWISTDVRVDQFYRAKQLGWIGIKPDHIEDLAQIGPYQTSPDGYVTRGIRGQEIAIQTDAERYRRIQYAKDRKNREMMRDSLKQKAQMIDAAAQQFGGEAADFLNRESGPTGRVTEMYERISRTPDGIT